MSEPDYRRDYHCSGCGQTGIKLWRDYNTCASAVDLKCAECATPKQVEYDAKEHYNGYKSPLEPDGVFAYREGDQLGGLVPAIPTEEGDTLWGYSSVPSECVLWWHALPTYRDDEREQRCLRNLIRSHARTGRCRQDSLLETRSECVAMARKLGEHIPTLEIEIFNFDRERDIAIGCPTTEMLRAALLEIMRRESAVSKQYRDEMERQDDLRWKLERIVYRCIVPTTITIWGTVTKDCGNGYVLRHGEDQPRELQVGDRIALGKYGRAHLIDPESDTLRMAWSIQDCGQDGDALVAKLRASGHILQDLRQ